MKTLEYFKNFQTSLGFTVDFQVSIDHNTKEFDILTAYERIGSEIYSVMPEVVFDDSDHEAIKEQIFGKSKENT